VEERIRIIRLATVRRASSTIHSLSMTKIVKKSLSDSRLTAARKRRLEKLSRQPDEQIKTSDIPEFSEKFWQNAVRNPFYRPLKQH
jgi:hypothetical protein